MDEHRTKAELADELKAVRQRVTRFENLVRELKQVHGTLRLQRDRANALVEMSKVLAESGLDHQTVLDMVARRMAALVGGACVIYLLSNDGQWLRSVALHHPDPETSASMRDSLATAPLHVGDGPLGRVAQTGQPLLEPDVHDEGAGTSIDSEHLPPFGEGGLHSLLVVPLRAGGRVIGVLTMSRESPESPYGFEDQEFVELLSNQASLSIANTQLYGRLRQSKESARLDSIGRLAAGVAHEINNPLFAILAQSELMMAKEVPDEIRRPLRTIVSQGERAARIVKNLSSFARKGEPRKSYLDVGAVIEMALNLKSADFRDNNVHVFYELSEDVPRTMFDEDQIIDVLVNILSNAEEVMAEANAIGRLTVLCESSTDRVRISITDDGPGIPSEHLNKIFDPFFTTKEPGSGTGLGLSISYGIMKGHGGDLRVESEFGSGSTFHVELPIETPEPGLEPAEPVEAIVDSPSRRILVVEDEPALRKILLELLSDHGYEVDVAVNGIEAWEKLNAGEYDLVLLDVRLPEMNGEELYQRIMSRDEALAKRVVFMTGDTVTPHTREFIIGTGNPSLSKPFTLDELEKLVFSLLAQPDGTPVDTDAQG